jgi:hypothetical protein
MIGNAASRQLKTIWNRRINRKERKGCKEEGTHHEVIHELTVAHGA